MNCNETQINIFLHLKKDVRYRYFNKRKTNEPTHIQYDKAPCSE